MPFFHTTHYTWNSFQFPFCLLTQISTEPIFPSKPSYICYVWPSIFVPFHGQIAVLVLVKTPERGLDFLHCLQVLHAFMQGCTYQESENDFPHYVPSYSTRSPDFVTKSPNPHTAMPQAACCHSYNTSIVMKQLCWGGQKNAASFFLFNMHFVSLTPMWLAVKQIIHGLKYIYVNFAVNVIINV